VPSIADIRNYYVDANRVTGITIVPMQVAMAPFSAAGGQAARPLPALRGGEAVMKGDRR